MEELSMIEIDEVSGGRIIVALGRAAYQIMSGIYYAGMSAREMGMGDTYLEALRGGNMGA